MKEQKQAIARRNRWLLLGFLASFIVPIIIGQMAYDGGWFRGGQTNKGVLINPPLASADFAWQVGNSAGPALDKRWWVVYVVPKVCDDVCQQSLQALPRMHDSFGRERERLGVLLVLAPGEQALPEWLPEDLGAASYVQWAEASSVLESQLTTNSWYVMDPMGWIMLRYKIPSESAAAILQAQNVLDDLAKLLKASRIG